MQIADCGIIGKFIQTQFCFVYYTSRKLTQNSSESCSLHVARRWTAKRNSLSAKILSLWLTSALCFVILVLQFCTINRQPPYRKEGLNRKLINNYTHNQAVSLHHNTV